ncbi:MAG: hypothetical protein KJ624_05870 [Chloroflexi bacterium]|nr:hypothetical protein [Chloroflexota bacterium]
MIYWAPFFHFYQPPTQMYSVLKKVCDEAYYPLLQVFRDHPHAKATVNIQGVLSEMLWERGEKGVLEGLNELAERGQVEFTGSAKYHPILPLIPVEEMKHQIRRNQLTNRHFLGDLYQPRGFFPPEMAWSREVLEPVMESRHEWLLLAGVACPAAWPMDIIYQTEVDGERLALFFRDDILSNKISFQGIDGPGFIQHLRGLRSDKGDIYVITAMDAETFGHHILNWEKLFLHEVYDAIVPHSPEAPLKQRRALDQQARDLFNYAPAEITIVTISELLKRFPPGAAVEPRAGSWSTSLEDMKAENIYPLWNAKDNPIHHKQWEHLGLAIALVKKTLKLADNADSCRYADIARGLLDPAMHSCQFWWASCKPWWDINMIHRGLMEQQEVILNAYRSIQLSGCPEPEKREAYYKLVASRDLAVKIVDRILAGSA